MGLLRYARNDSVVDVIRKNPIGYDTLSREVSQMKAQEKILIGLTGGVAAGKSEVASLFTQEGLRVINLDAIGRKLIDTDPNVQHGLKKIFGNQAFENNRVNRIYLREKMFSSPVLKEKLETFLHPLIWSEFNRQVEDSLDRLIVCEAALLVEKGRQFREMIVVSCPEKIRRERLIRRDSISEVLVQQMLDAQLPDAAKEAAASIVIQNTGDKEALKKVVHEIIEKLRSKYVSGAP